MEGDRPHRRERCDNRLAAGPVQPIRVPMALGAVRRGVDQGAEVLDEALRARFVERQERALADRLRPSETVPVPPLAGPEGAREPGGALYLEPIAAACQALAERVAAAIDCGALPLTLGGDHAVSIGSVAGAAAAAERLAVVWIDAHADLNWPVVSPTGHVHGMPLGARLGRGPAILTEMCRRSPKAWPEDVYLIGIRDLDPSERRWLREAPFNAFPVSALDAMGLEEAIAAVVARIRASGVDAVHVSFDVDALDPSVMPGTGTRALGGLTYREAAHLLRLLRGSDLPIRSLDWVELNPALDPSGASVAAATELLAAALGEEPF